MSEGKTWKLLQWQSKWDNNDQISQPFLNIRTLKKCLPLKLSLVMPPHSLCPDPAFPFASVQASLCLLHPREGKANVPTWKDPSDCSSSPRLTQHRNKVRDFGRALLGLFLEEVQIRLGSRPCCRMIHRLGLPLLGMLLCVKGTVTAAKCRREHHSHSLYHALPPTTKHPKAEQQVRKDK